MIRIRNEQDFRNWFKKNYKKLGFSKILKSNTKGFPDFVMLKNNKEVKVELEIKSSNFILHNHSSEKVDMVVCVIEDVKLGIPTKIAKGVRVMDFGEGESQYSFKKQILKLIKRSRVVTTSEISSILNISWGASERALMELALDGEIKRIKKEGVNLWLRK